MVPTVGLAANCVSRPRGGRAPRRRRGPPGRPRLSSALRARCTASASSVRPRLRSAQPTIQRATRVRPASPIRSRASRPPRRPPARPAEVARRRRAPCRGCSAARRPSRGPAGPRTTSRDRQGLLGEPRLLLGRRHQRDHVQRVDLQRLQPGRPRGGRGGLEVRASLVGLAARAQQPAALERGPGRDLGVVGGEVVETAWPSSYRSCRPSARATWVISTSRSLPSAVSRGLAEPLLGAGRVVEVPQRGRVDHAVIVPPLVWCG